MVGLDSSTTISVKNYNLPPKYSLFLRPMLLISFVVGKLQPLLLLLRHADAACSSQLNASSSAF
jgi:hypothetical protein